MATTLQEVEFLRLWAPDQKVHANSATTTLLPEAATIDWKASSLSIPQTGTFLASR